MCWNAEGMTRRETALFHGSGSERREANYISNRVNVWNIRLIMFIDLQESSFIGLQAYGFDVERASRAGPPDAIKRHLGDDLFATEQMYFDAVSMVVSNWLDHIHFFTETHDSAFLVEMISERVDNFCVHEWEQAAALVNDRHAHAQRGKNTGIFETNHARTDNGQRAR